MSESVSAKRVLLVDDEAHILHVVAMKLRGAGFEVHTAGDGEEGFTAAKELEPDLIVSDLQMPFMDGIELAHAIKCDDRLCKTPVLMLTARGFSIPKEKLDETNVVAVLSKPFSPREVLAKVEELTDGRGGHAGAA